MSSDRVIKSFLAPGVLAQRLAIDYGLQDARCQLITATLRDVYHVISRMGHHILIVYRHDQQTLDEIAAEWQLVDYLARQQVPVVPAIPARNGNPILTFQAPEGRRYGVVTDFIAGRHLRQRPSPDAARCYGQIIATIHVLADRMPTPFTRSGREVGAILAQSIAAIQTVVLDRPADVAYLAACATELQRTLSGLPQQSPKYGIIHGDVIRTNALVADDGTVSVIDFELCGLGWRVYDVASYLLTIRGDPQEDRLADAFLAGYTSTRPLMPQEYARLPLFEAIRAIFEIGTPAHNVDHWGSAYLYAFFDRSLERLKRSMQQL
ncbi:MAG TPA: phosphotransferase [Herpetosiphonaceae bacterium]|nr:phosphotransferase [Herpetosiphonaceae bacterium]